MYRSTTLTAAHARVIFMILPVPERYACGSLDVFLKG